MSKKKRKKYSKNSGRKKDSAALNKKTSGKPEPVISISASDRESTDIDVPVKPKILVDKAKIRRTVINNSVALMNVVLVGGILLTGSVYTAAFKHETKADDENRYLAEFPDFSISSYINGDYTEGIANYFDDTVHGRAHIKEFIADKLMPLKGRAYGGEEEVELYGQAHEHDNEPVTAAPTIAVVTTAAPVTEQTSITEAATDVTETDAPTEPTEAPQPKLPPSDDMNAADGEVTNNILIVNKRGITLYGGGWGGELQYASYLNEYKAALPDVNVYSMPLPTSCSFYLPDKYKSLAASEKDDFDKMAAAYDGVIAVDAYSNLQEHADEPIYSRTDHHWQPLGAYYAAQAFAKAADVPFDDLSDYEEVVLPGYVGTLYNFTQSSKLLNNPEDFVYYKPKHEVTVTQYDTAFNNPVSTSLLLDPSYFGTSGYYMVFGADSRIAHVHTDCGNGRTLVIFKDSYGNALLPMLTGSFENIYLCDIRYFDRNAVDFIKEVGATDLLFSMCSYSAVGVNKNNIYNNLHK